MTDIKWGPAIAVDGKPPEWLQDWQPIRGTYNHGRYPWVGDDTYLAKQFHWEHVASIRLPADHPHYRQTEAAPIDWSGELEAVHEDGRVVRVTVDKGPDKDGDRAVMPQLDGVGRLFGKDGTPWSNNGWRIRNVSQPTPQADTKPDLTARKNAMTITEVREMLAYDEDAIIQCMIDWGFALPEPVDEDLIEAREIAAETVPSWTDAQRTKCRSGEYDGNLFVVHSFAGIKRGRALALAGEKEA